MKLFLGIAAACIFAMTASAAPCASAPLSTYLAAGFECEIDSAVFSDFSFALQNDSSDTVALTEDEITVSPLSAGNRLGLRLAGDFAAVGAVNGPGPTDGLRNITYRFMFDITRPATLFTNVIAQLNGPSRFSPDPFEFGGIFASNNITNDGALAIAHDDDPGFMDDDSLNTPREPIFVDALINLTGGGSLAGTMAPVGSVTLRSADLLYDFEPAVVPEPGTWAICVSGLGLLFAFRRRRSRPAR
jgi:hypothetical protein